MNDLTIEQAQKNQPWTVPYSSGVMVALNNVPHILASHTVLHATKSVGKLASVFESLDHTNARVNESQLQTIRDMAADLMAAALRIANLYQFNLADEVERRAEEKNGRGFR